MLEREDHVELVARRIGEQRGVLDARAGRLADQQQPVAASVEHLVVHLLEELVQAGSVDVPLPASP